MTIEELDAECRRIAKAIDEAPLYDHNELFDLLAQAETMRKEFVRLYDLDKEDE